VRDGTVQAHLVSEVSGKHRAEVVLRLLDFHGEPYGTPEAVDENDKKAAQTTTVHRSERDILSPAVARSLVIAENHVQPVWAVPLDALPCSAEEAFLEASLEVPDLAIRTKSILFLTEPKRCARQDPGLEMEFICDREGGLELSVWATKAPAFYVSAELEDVAGQFEDAGFYCAKGERRTLRFIPAEPQSSRGDARHNIAQCMPAGQLKLCVHHLQNSFEH